MSSALETFRAQREAAEQIEAKLKEISQLLRNVEERIQAVGRDDQFRRLVSDEQLLVSRSSELLNQLRWHRETEIARFWPWVWRRWALVVLLALLTLFGAGAGYVWAVSPYATELAAAREQAAWAGSLRQRIARLTPAERKQFDMLIK